jgi:trk system potassium uptake protein TrkA
MGLFGRSLALDLARAGSEVIAIDIDVEKLDAVRDEVTVAVALDATDEKELRAQGVHKVDLLVASIGDDFEANQLLVVLAKSMGVPRILARAPSKRHSRILELLGATEVVLPEVEAADRTARRILKGNESGAATEVTAAP